MISTPLFRALEGQQPGREAVSGWGMHGPVQTVTCPAGRELVTSPHPGQQGRRVPFPPFYFFLPFS